jgi:hypothetical protein
LNRRANGCAIAGRRDLNRLSRSRADENQQTAE